MRQIGLVPAGCQQAFLGGVAVTENYVCYASSVAIYFLDPDTFKVVKIISYNSRAICSFVLSPRDPNCAVIGSLDGTICAWNVATETMISRATLSINVHSFIDMDHFEADLCVIALNNPHVHAYTWRVRSAIEDSEQLVPISDCMRRLADSRLVTALKCSPLSKGLFSIGFDEGSVLIHSTLDSKKNNQLRAPTGSESGRVKDLQWDEKSNIYLLVAYTQEIYLWDIDNSCPVHSYDKQGTGLCCLSWMSWAAGSFVSSNPKTGILKVWNASQRHALEAVRVPCSGGIIGLKFLLSKPIAICSCGDGSVLAYDFSKRDVVNSTCSGHTDTVFDSCFSPMDPNIIATCSFDGTLKIWNITELSLLRTFFDANSIFYSCTWSPCGKLLAACTFKGEVIIWNIDTGRAVVKYQHHTKASYCVRWNCAYPQMKLVCSTSADGSAVVFEVPIERFADARSGSGIVLGSSKKKNSIQEDTPMLCRIQYTVSAFGCAWCPSIEDIFCVGYKDSTVRIFNYKSAKSNPSPLFALKGHTDRVFSCAWSPLVPGLLATGSDDKTVAIWKLNLDNDANVIVPHKESGIVRNVAKNIGLLSADNTSPVTPFRILSGHRSNVRALSWNHEHEDVLQSGSWDSSIKIWNARKGTCVQSANGHLLDVYTICSHPRRPFCYVSTSRDTTIRVWELQGIFTRMRTRTVLDFSMDMFLGKAKKIETNADESTEPTLDSSEESIALGCFLHGLQSRILATMIKETRSKIYARSGIPECDKASFWTVCCSDEKNILDAIEVLKVIFDFFCGSNGSVQMWGAAKRVLDETDNTCGNYSSTMLSRNLSISGDAVSTNAPIVLEGQVLSIAKSEALQAESLIPSSKRHCDSELDVKYVALLRKAAMAYLKAGDFLKYCRILIELGDWLEAIAMAPCISQEFWEGLTLLYAKLLSSERSHSSALPFYVAVGRDFQGAEGCLRNRDYHNAMVITKMSELRADVISARYIDNASSGASDAEVRKATLNKLFSDAEASKPSCRQRTETEDEAYRAMARKIISLCVRESWLKSNVFEAAARCFVVGDSYAAFKLLILGGELDAAISLSMCFGLDRDKELVRNLAFRSVYLGDLDLSCDVVSMLPVEDSKQETTATTMVKHGDRKHSAPIQAISNIDIERGLLVCRGKYGENVISKAEYLEHCGLPALHMWLQYAVEMEAVGHDADAVACYTVCGDLSQAAGIATECLKTYMLPSVPGEKINLPPAANNVYSRAKQIRKNMLHRALDIIDIDLRNSFLCCVFWIAAHQALYCGIYDIAWKFLSVMKKNMPSVSRLPVSVFDVECQELRIRISMGDEHVHELLLGLSIQIQDGKSSMTSGCGSIADVEKAKACIIDLHTIIKKNLELANCDRNGYPFDVNEATGHNMENCKLATSSPFQALKKFCRHLPRVPDMIQGEDVSSDIGIDISGLSSIRAGSRLPQANHKIKKQHCFITNKVVCGGSVCLQDGFSYISTDDAATWASFCPFSPLADGSVLDLL